MGHGGFDYAVILYIYATFVIGFWAVKFEGK
jgi:hypothetical protein